MSVFLQQIYNILFK